MKTPVLESLFNKVSGYSPFWDLPFYLITDEFIVDFEHVAKVTCNIKIVFWEWLLFKVLASFNRD